MLNYEGQFEFFESIGLEIVLIFIMLFFKVVEDFNEGVEMLLVVEGESVDKVDIDVDEIFCFNLILVFMVFIDEDLIFCFFVWVIDRDNVLFFFGI